MKRIIFYCALMLSGIVGFSNWIIATSVGTANSAAWGGVHGSDWLFIVLFVGMFLSGLIGAIIELRNER